MSSFLSTFYHEGTKCDVTGEDISKGLKMAATLLEYPETWGIPIELVDTHLLRCGGANALALLGFSDCHKPPNHGIGGIIIPPKNGATR
jgi:hypothetical protein